MKRENKTIIIDYTPVHTQLYAILLLSPFFIKLFEVWFAKIPQFIQALTTSEVQIPSSFFQLSFVLVLLIYGTYEVIVHFRKKPSHFIFEKDKVVYDTSTGNLKQKFVEKNIFDIATVRYILITELITQHGFVEKKTLLKKFFKSDIGDLVFETLFRIIQFIYWLLGLPVRIFRLWRKNESLSMLWKNLYIEFEDGEVFVIDLYHQDNLNSITKILDKHQITISSQIKISTFLHKDKRFSVTSY
ncbi:MAG TPA: hypothetical protein ENK98_00490 [Epsilonproteobacteria bacterium]|nr:hypothetical protein [Campylobacterota bacterium]